MTQPSCKGLFFNITQNQYWDKEKACIYEKRSLRLLKRKSCRCPSCDYVIKECLPEVINDCNDFSGSELQPDRVYELIYDFGSGEDFEFEWRLAK